MIFLRCCIKLLLLKILLSGVFFTYKCLAFVHCSIPILLPLWAPGRLLQLTLTARPSAPPALRDEKPGESQHLEEYARTGSGAGRGTATGLPGKASPAPSDEADSPSLLDISNYTPKPGPSQPAEGGFQPYTAPAPAPGAALEGSAAAGEGVKLEAGSEGTKTEPTPAEDEEGDFMCSGGSCGDLA